MTQAALILAGLLAAAADPAPDPPPLTTEQRARLSQLAQEIQGENMRLRALLEERQNELARVYADYDLDEKRADKLEAEILDLQRQMLTSYRKLQVELRATVGRERFVLLKKRLDNMLKTAGQNQANPSQSPSRQ